MVTVKNDGRLTLTLRGLGTLPADGPQIFAPIGLRLNPSGGGSGHAVIDPAHPLRLAPHETRALDVTFRVGLRCPTGQPKPYWSGGNSAGTRVAVPFRIHYGHIFDRTQSVLLPYGFAFACAGNVEPVSD
jgi:hypothetical protein